MQKPIKAAVAAALFLGGCGGTPPGTPVTEEKPAVEAVQPPHFPKPVIIIEAPLPLRPVADDAPTGTPGKGRQETQ